MSMSIGGGPTLASSSSRSTSAASDARHSTRRSRQAQSTAGQATPTRFPISLGLYVSPRRRIPQCRYSSWAILWCVQPTSYFGCIYKLRGSFGLGRCIGTVVRDASPYAGERLAAVGHYCVEPLYSPHQAAGEYHTLAWWRCTRHPAEPEHTSVR